MLTSRCGDAPLTPVCTPTSRYALAMLCGRPKGEAAALNMTMGLCWLCVLVLNIGTNTGELECLERPVVRCLFPLKLAKFIQRRGAEAQRRRGRRGPQRNPNSSAKTLRPLRLCAEGISGRQLSCCCC